MICSNTTNTTINKHKPRTYSSNDNTNTNNSIIDISTTISIHNSKQS